MLKKIFKWAAIGLLSIILLLGLSFGIISFLVDKRMDKTYSFKKTSLDIPGDSATIDRGAHLVTIKGCNDCHGKQMDGKIMIDDFPMGRLSAANLTGGQGGLDQNFTVEDWVMALKHGVGTDGKPLLLMPAHETTQLTDKDLSAIIAYCRSLPPVDHILQPNKIGPLARILTHFDKIPLLSVEMIDHKKAENTSNAEPKDAIAMGRYLAVSCTGCHRENFKGGDAFVPGKPPMPNISASGNPGKWTEQQFTQVLRTGKTPAGHEMNSDDMPWKMTAQYTDEEISSIYQFLNSIK
ncbi:MAG TPA: c-type cytochrome [Pedobacter sp.]|nr:c-type cytochrome [Pedobacter sp.]